MSLILDGTNGLSDVDGSAATPAIRGSDANTGVFFGADIIGFSEGGTECARFNADAQFVAAAGTASLPVITTTGDVNTGIFFSAANTIDIATDGVARAQINGSGDFAINAGFGSVGKAYLCRAWVNFNGTGTPAIRASGNVSSITDNGTGSYTVNFTTAMPDANYSAVVTGGADLLDTSGQKFAIMGVSTFLTTSANVVVRQADNDNNTFVAADTDQVCLAIFR
jgi:hypothetical protein